MMNNELPAGTVLRSRRRAYTVVRKLGSGGFGITYLVEADIDGIPVYFAIKELFMSSCCERDGGTHSVTYSNPVRKEVENARKDFIAEARRLGDNDVRHPNIVKINEVFEANNTAYYVMEFLEGESLRQYIDRRGPLNEQEAVNLITPILHALELLHNHRITHLDIKPENIIVSRNRATGRQRPVLIDFGLSKHYTADGHATSTIRTQGISDGYAPLEQYGGITTFSPATDVYAVAATICFMLTGRRPPKATELNPEAYRQELLKVCSANTAYALTAAMSPFLAQRTQSIPALRATLPKPDFSQLGGETKTDGDEATWRADEPTDGFKTDNGGSFHGNETIRDSQPGTDIPGESSGGKRVWNRTVYVAMIAALICGVLFIVGGLGYVFFRGATGEASAADSDSVEVVEIIPDEDLVEFRVDGKSGYLRKNSNEVVIQPQFDVVFGFRNGTSMVRKARKYGIIDTTGDWVVPCVFDNLLNFGWSSNYPDITEGEIGGSKYYIDRKGKYYENKDDAIAGVNAVPLQYYPDSEN